MAILSQVRNIRYFINPIHYIYHFSYIISRMRHFYCIILALAALAYPLSILTAMERPPLASKVLPANR